MANPVTHPTALPPFIDQPSDLHALSDLLAAQTVIAVDTEFHAERRYRPELMLVQLGVPDGPVYTVDPLALDLTPLHAALHAKTWIAHGAQRDVELLHLATGARPSELIDTQLLAGFAGLHYPARLEDLVTEVLGVRLDKGATLSDWHHRPLTHAQLEYARGDVRLLCPLSAALQERIAQIDHQIEAREAKQWAAMAGRELIEQALAPRGPQQHWRSLEIASTLDAHTRAALHALYVWREDEARRKNSPPHYILAPSIALDLARRRPQEVAQIRENRRIPSGLTKRHGQAILKTLRDAEQRPAPPPIRDIEKNGLRPFLEAWSVSVAARLRIAHRLLAPRSTIEMIARREAQAQTGWRHAVLGAEWNAILSGNSGLVIGADEVVTVHRIVGDTAVR